ncbi:MAG: CDP-glucose 4,6-dehydratase [Methanoregula sp.]
MGQMNFKDRLSDAYKGKTVLITGHTGFKGGWLALWLHSLGAKIVGYSLNTPTNPSFFHETGLKNLITDIRGDILEREKLIEVVKKFHPDFIFHLAAQPLVRDSYKNPCDTFNVNVMGTVNILEAIRLCRRPTTCVCITSDKCYENREWIYAYRENDSLGGYDPYSASKGAGEIAIASYRKSFFNPNEKAPISSISSARAGNIIGGGDWAANRIVPDCIRSLIKDDPIRIRNPEAVRPWQFVLDPLSGYLLLGLRMRENPSVYADAWNFGPHYSSNITVREIAEKVIGKWGSGKWEITLDEENPVHEAGYLKLDIAKAMTKLEWKPVYGIDRTIQKTVEWYKQNNSGNRSMIETSLDQIHEFTDCAEKMYNLDRI